MGVFLYGCGCGYGAGLILVVAEAEFLSDLGEGVEFGEEFVDGEVGDGEFTVFESGGFGLSADGDHGVHEVVVLGDVADFDLDALAVEIADGFGAPGAAGFHVKDGFCFTLHILKSK